MLPQIQEHRSRTASVSSTALPGCRPVVRSRAQCCIVMVLFRHLPNASAELVVPGVVSGGAAGQARFLISR